MHQVFISYSNLDRPVAEAACVALEAGGIACWIAPRDISPSKEWAEQIIDGINGARVMLLVFSSRSNGSPQVRREIERAIHKELSVIPFRIENVEPTKSLEYFLSAQHWFDAHDAPVETHLPRLSRLIAELCNDAGAQDKSATPHSSGPGPDPSPTPPRGNAHTLTNDPVPAGHAAGGPAKASTAATANPFPENELTIIEAHLARHIGPIARVLVRRTAQSSSDHQALLVALANELDLPSERSAFMAACRKQLKH
jgi:hypothetical protein